MADSSLNYRAYPLQHLTADAARQRLAQALASAPGLEVVVDGQRNRVLVRGTFGPDAGALGAATLPMFFNFSPRAGILMGAGAQTYAQAQEESHVALDHPP